MSVYAEALIEGSRRAAEMELRTLISELKPKDLTTSEMVAMLVPLRAARARLHDASREPAQVLELVQPRL